MKYWIIPGNVNIFRVIDYFKDFDVVDWKQSHYSFEIGDIVFLYVSAPYSKIMYMLEVVKRDIPYNESKDDKIYWTHKHEIEQNIKNFKYVRLKLLKQTNNSNLSLSSLCEFGLSTAPQGASHKLSKALIDYILTNFEK